MIKLHVYYVLHRFFRDLTIRMECDHKEDFSELKTAKHKIYRKLCAATMRLSFAIHKARKNI